MPYTEEQKKEHILELQQYLYAISMFREDIPQILPSGVYDKETVEAVRAFQKAFGLPQTGEADPDTWDMIVKVYLDYLDSAPAAYHAFPSREYILHDGDSGQLVYIIQAMLNEMGKSFDNMPEADICGKFNTATVRAVKIFQQKTGLEENGCVDCHTWNMLVHSCESIKDK